MSRATKVIISINPFSGSSSGADAVEQLQRCLSEKGYQVSVLSSIQDVCKLAIELSEGGELKAVVAAGGDGTVSLLVNTLPSMTPIAILPLGTENLLAKYFEVPMDPLRVAELIDVGESVCLDVGRANGKIFLIMASCGFDAEVVRKLHSQRKGNIRHWSYVKPIWDSIRQYRYPKIQIFVDHQPQPIQTSWAFAFNVPRYAMNLPIVADADPLDGELDLCTFREGKFLRSLYYFFLVLLGYHRKLKEGQLYRFKRIRVEAVDADAEIPFQLDGDPGGVLPLEIEVLPKFFRVVAAKSWIDNNTANSGSARSVAS